MKGLEQGELRFLNQTFKISSGEARPLRFARGSLSRMGGRTGSPFTGLRKLCRRCDCGADIDRDVAAAMVVHARAFGFWPGAGLESLSERVAA